MEALKGAHLVAGAGKLLRFIPEPKTKLGSTFKTILDVGSGVFGGGMGGASTVGISQEYRDLLVYQMQVQDQMQRVSMTSNIEKSKHETQMAAVRNLRVG